MKDKLQTLADELEDIMDKKAEVEEVLRPIEEREAEIRKELAQGLIAKGFQYIKTTSGLGFGIVKGRVMYAVKDGREHEAMQWATENFPGVLTISAARLNKVVQPMLNVPEFIERKEGLPHLSVRTTNEAY